MSYSNFDTILKLQQVEIQREIEEQLDSGIKFTKLQVTNPCSLEWKLHLQGSTYHKPWLLRKHVVCLRNSHLSLVMSLLNSHLSLTDGCRFQYWINNVRLYR